VQVSIFNDTSLPSKPEIRLEKALERSLNLVGCTTRLPCTRLDAQIACTWQIKWNLKHAGRVEPLTLLVVCKSLSVAYVCLGDTLYRFVAALQSLIQFSEFITKSNGVPAVIDVQYIRTPCLRLHVKSCRLPKSWPFTSCSCRQRTFADGCLSASAHWLYVLHVV